ncbi:hypothetical protein ACIQNU_00815 [Streptomyces sp. NPDC091292]|uniref:hypothetical protein n=1 Tax=Streptomyces sp. NPDC091292 TaxID=3365991 RepID=UPI0038291181
MSHLWTAHRIRTTRHPRRKNHTPHTLIDILLNGDPHPDDRTDPAPPTTTPRPNHPVLIHVLGTCLATTS